MAVWLPCSLSEPRWERAGARLALGRPASGDSCLSPSHSRQAADNEPRIKRPTWSLVRFPGFHPPYQSHADLRAWPPHLAPYLPVPPLTGIWRWAAMCFGQRLPRRTQARPAGMGTPGVGVAPEPASPVRKGGNDVMCGLRSHRSRLLAASLTGEQLTGFEMGQCTPKKTLDFEATSEGREHQAHPQRTAKSGGTGNGRGSDGARETDRRIFGRRGSPLMSAECMHADCSGLRRHAAAGRRGRTSTCVSARS